MHIAEITERAGADRRPKRVGRGEGSGSGKTSGRGTKGCGARSGWKRRGMQEGGQMPTFRRMPKRGFSNAQFETRYHVVNVEALETAYPADFHVTPQELRESGLIRNARLPVKILGEGVLTKKLTVDAAKFSKSAIEKITQAGGEARVRP